MNIKEIEDYEPETLEEYQDYIDNMIESIARKDLNENDIQLYIMLQLFAKLMRLM